MVGNIDADVFHDSDGMGVQPNRLRTCTGDFEAAASQMPQPSFSHLTAAGVPRAEE
jgi:hypothetical protein